MHSELFDFALARNMRSNCLEGSGHTSPSQVHILLKPTMHEFEKPEKEVVLKLFAQISSTSMP